jgi:quinol monooxygenase YgiN
MVELILQITAHAKGVPAMVQALANLMFQAKLEAGCLDCQLYAQTANSRVLHYVEQWATREDMDKQIRSTRFSLLLATLETAAEAPLLEIRTVSEQRGLDYIKALRLSGKQGVREGRS